MPVRQTEIIRQSEYATSGCMQYDQGKLLGDTVWAATRGMMCLGCPLHERGCKSLEKILNARKQTQKTVTSAPSETVREEAARTGRSISEVRRSRRES